MIVLVWLFVANWASLHSPVILCRGQATDTILVSPTYPQCNLLHTSVVVFP